MRIIVTGVAGFIGSNLVPRLLAEGHEVIGIDNFFLGKREFLAPYLDHPGFMLAEMDLLERSRVEELFLMVRPGRVWHLAANSDIGYGTRFTDFDLKGGTLVSYNVLEAMRLSGCKEILFSSSGAIYGEPAAMPTPEDYGPLYPISYYAASKLACEGLITAFAHNNDMRAWIYRFGNIVGPNATHGVIHDFVKKLQENPHRLEVLGDGHQSKPYVHVDDCLDGMAFGHQHAQARFNLYNLAVPDQTSVRRIAELTIEAMGLRNVEVIYQESPRGWSGDVPLVKLDNSRMKALGWEPQMNSDQAVKATIEAVVKQFGQVTPA